MSCRTGHAQRKVSHRVRTVQDKYSGSRSIRNWPPIEVQSFQPR
jgi:hypothetical protein